MAIVPTCTVRLKDKNKDVGEIVINESDFDESVHSLVRVSLDRVEDEGSGNSLSDEDDETGSTEDEDASDEEAN